MDILTLHLAEAVLRHRSIRAVARQAGRAPSTVSGAVSRVEAAIAVPLIRREGANLVLTIEAEQRAPHFARLAGAIRALLAPAAPARVPAIRIAALARLAAVAHAGSIRAAARRVGVGQPQLARQMADLERMLGLPLLARTPGGTTLSERGRAILPLAEAVVEDWEGIASAAANRFRRDMATWRIGTVLPLGHESSIARMLARLTVMWAHERRRHPLLMSSHTADELMIGLKSRRLDLIVVDHARIPREFLSLPLATTPLALVGRRDVLAPDADMPALLRRHALVLPSARSGIRQESMAYLTRILGERGARDLPLVELDSIPVIINLVAEHGYLSVLPLDSVTRLPFALNHVSLAPDHMQRLVLAWRRTGLPASLVEMVSQAMEDVRHQA